MARDIYGPEGPKGGSGPAGPAGPQGAMSRLARKKAGNRFGLPDDASNPMTWVRGVGGEFKRNLVDPMYRTFTGQNFSRYANPASGQNVGQRLTGLGEDILNIASVIPGVRALAMAPEALGATRIGQPLARRMANRQTMKEFGGFMNNVDPIDFDVWSPYGQIRKPRPIPPSKRGLSDYPKEIIDLTPENMSRIAEDVAPGADDITNMLSPEELRELRDRAYIIERNQSFADVERKTYDLNREANEQYVRMSQEMARHPRIRQKLIDEYIDLFYTKDPMKNMVDPEVARYKVSQYVDTMLDKYYSTKTGPMGTMSPEEAALAPFLNQSRREYAEMILKELRRARNSGRGQ